MKKTTLLSLQVLLVFTACSCIIGGLTSQPHPEASDPDQLPSDFELWAQGKLPTIQLTSGQESLTNFREQFQIQISGADENGAAFNGYQEYLIEMDRATDHTRELETIQVPSRYLSGVREWVVADGFTYLVRDANQGGRVCEKNENPADTSHISPVHVTRVLQTITPGELLERNVWVQDVLADAYEIESAGFLFVIQLNTISGTVWIAQQPTYFIKAEGAVEGVFEFESTRYSGGATFNYEIKDFDQVQVQLPALCAHPPEEMIPLPSNAAEVQAYPQMITFSSPDPVDQVMSFYLAELVSQGWQVERQMSDAFEHIVTARITTPQDIQISAEVKIIDMGAGSYVQIAWQAND
jgi:hypothetical protein